MHIPELVLAVLDCCFEPRLFSTSYVTLVMIETIDAWLVKLRAYKPLHDDILVSTNAVHFSKEAVFTVKDFHRTGVVWEHAF